MTANLEAMRKLLDDLEAALQAQSPPMTAKFAKPATEAAIRKAEEDLETTFPDDLRVFLLCANGQKTDKDGIYPAGDFIVPSMKFVPGGSELSAWGFFLQLDKIVEHTGYQYELSEYDDDDEGRKYFGPVAYHHRQIILTQADDPVSIALDLQPAEGGQVGQVITFNDQPDYTAWLAPSLSVFLQMMVDGYRAGRFQRHEDGTTMREA